MASHLCRVARRDFHDHETPRPFANKPMPSEIKLPKLKENVDTVEVNEVLVQLGQIVEKDQPLIVVNADKSNMEVYAPIAGKIVQLNVKVGDEIKIGSVYCVIEGANGATVASAAPPAATETPEPYRPRTPQQRKDDAIEEVTEQQVRVIREEVHAPPPPPPSPRVDAVPAFIPASPATRWLARKLGIDLRTIRGSGPKGRITEEDVKAAYAGPASGPVVTVGGGFQLPALPNFEEFGKVEREPLTRVRKLTAQKMSLAWTLIPHVTQNDLADITELEAFRKSQEKRGIKLTITAFALKACAIALKQFPIFNATLDLQNNQLIFKKYYHIGVAVDTKGGLLVPVIRDVDRKGIEELGRELAETAEKARAGKADMTGGTFTITNLGGIGGTSFTPIINWPEVAILGMSRSRLEPVVKEGQIVPRMMLPLSLSYDHRVIDGADAARFTRRVAELLESPWLMLLHG
jgi:pyruvate dehydrogenase E2 component (dihydrolipoamide acetyltransferase)